MGVCVIRAEFNVNDHVRVKLTDVGRRHLTLPVNQPRTVTEDADGWSRWQLWDLMHTFGEVVYMGGAVPFDTDIEIEIT